MDKYRYFVLFGLIAVLSGILAGCASSSSEWKKTLAVNTLDAYKEFLASYPSDEHTQDARGKIDTLSYMLVKDKLTIASFEQYLRDFPDGKFSTEAAQRLEKLYFYQKTEKGNTVSAYDDFLIRFPNGVFASEAKARREELYFNQVISAENTIPSYDLYLQEYPNGTFADSARYRIERITYEGIKAADTETLYLDYLKRYPDGTFKADALARVELCAFRDANKVRSIDAYEKYIRLYPQGTYTAIAIHNISTQAEAYREAKVVRVMVNQSYYQKNPDGSKDALTGISLPIESLSRRLLTDHAGRTAVGPDAKSYAATLTINTEGIALGKDYGTDTMHYTGASFNGTLTLELLGYPSVKRSFSSIIEPSATQVANSSNGTSAPFQKVYKSENSFLPRLLELMYKIYGVQAVISALRDADEDVRLSALSVCGAFQIPQAFTAVLASLRDNNFPVRQQAALTLGMYRDERAVDPLVKNLQEILDFDWIKDESDKAREKAAIGLGMIGNPKAVKPLIGSLKDPSPSVRKEVITALKKITKQNFNNDVDAWSKWWDGEKSKYNGNKQ